MRHLTSFSRLGRGGGLNPFSTHCLRNNSLQLAAEVRRVLYREFTKEV